jgi:hypothetical protein
MLTVAGATGPGVPFSAVGLGTTLALDCGEAEVAAEEDGCIED